MSALDTLIQSKSGVSSPISSGGSALDRLIQGKQGIPLEQPTPQINTNITPLAIPKVSGSSFPSLSPTIPQQNPPVSFIREGSTTPDTISAPKPASAPLKTGEVPSYPQSTPSTVPDSGFDRAYADIRNFVIDPTGSKSTYDKAQTLNQYFAEKNPTLAPKLSTLEKITNQIDTMSFPEKLISVGVLGSFAAAPVATAIGFSEFTALDTVAKKAISAITQKNIQNFSDVLPENTPQYAKDLTDVLAFLGEGYAIHGINKTAPAVLETLTKNIAIKYNLPQTVFIDGDKVRSIFGSPKDPANYISPEEEKLVQSLGLTADQYKTAIKNGIPIEVPIEKITTITDKPYWAKFKEAIGVKPSEAQVNVETPGKPTQGVRGLLAEGNGVSHPALDNLITSKLTETPIETKPSETPAISKDLQPLTQEEPQVPKLSKEQIVERKSIIVSREAQVREIYSGSPHTQDALDSILTELSLSEAGSRYSVPGIDATGQETSVRDYKSIPSTFPDWIPEEYRSKALFEKVMEGLKDPNNIQFPTDPRAVKQRELYNLLLDEVDERAGVDTKQPRYDILNAYDEISSKMETPTGLRRGVSGSEEIDTSKLFGEPTPTDKGITLSAGINPNLGVFLKEDFIPTAKTLATGLKESLDGLLNVLNPRRGVSTPALDEVMKMKGERDKAEFVLEQSLQKIKGGFSKMPQSEQIAFIDRVKRGEAQPNPNLQAVADLLRKLDTEIWTEANKYKPSLAWKENHFRVLWKVIPGSVEGKGGFKGLFRRPLQGTKGFLKQATLPDISSGIERGGVPYSYNPITLFQMAYADMMRFITAQKMWASYKSFGLREFVKVGSHAPDGFIKLNDNIARVVFPVQEGMVHSGDWYVEENAGRILNNFLSRDLVRETALGRSALWIKNNTTAIELALSPFHAIFESIETTGSSIGLGLQKIWNRGILQGDMGAIGSGVKDILTSPFSPKTTASMGGSAIRYITNKEEFLKSSNGQDFLKRFPDADRLLDDLFTGGGKLAMHQDYKIKTIQTFKENIASGNYIGSTLRLLPAANELLMKPLFEYYIPRLKIGMFLKEYSNELLQRKNDLASGRITRAQLARQIWDFTEDRLGEMNFDNLFWNRTFKSGLQLLFRSVTWKLGNLRATGGAIFGQAKEILSAVKERRAPILHRNMAWLLGMTAITATIAEVIQTATTGKRPQSAEDLVYPQIDSEGNRVSIPTYWRDIIHLSKDQMGYIKSSLSGEIGRIADIWQNRDFYGVEVYDSTDPTYKQAWDIATHLVPQPFSISSATQFSLEGKPKIEQVAGFLGFTKAPTYITRSPIEQDIVNLYSKRIGQATKTADQAVASQAKTEIRNLYKQGKNDEANKKLMEAIQKGYIQERGVTQFIHNADYPYNIALFKALPSQDQQNLLRKMSVDELNTYAWFVHADVKKTFSSLSENAASFVKMGKDGKLTEPKYKQGHLTQ